MARNSAGRREWLRLLRRKTLIEQRRHMVNGQLRVGDVNDLSVLAAFLDTPREVVRRAGAGRVRLSRQRSAGAGSSGRRLLAPLTLARLLQAATVAPGERALDVGGGSGYSAAILEHLGAQRRRARIGRRRGGRRPARAGRPCRDRGRRRRSRRRRAGQGAVRRHSRQRRLREPAGRLDRATRRGRTPRRRRGAATARRKRC